jgi:lipopolysaccharide transport system ATP-binding protein
MSSDEIAISARNLTKSYRIFDHPGDRLKQTMSLGLRKYHREFTAILDVSLDILAGQSVGIIGRNGSGKSTLLQLVCGTLKPTSGSVKVHGRVSALLELGSGFNPEFTGRENVYFQGALTGFTRSEIDRRFDELASFADIGQFIDQPVRTYSSGMFVRLGFAVAVGFDPQILIVDEALAVGDARFQQKCFRRIEQLRTDGVTILLVSHATEQITRLCDVGILLDGGKLLAVGSPAAVTSQYHSLLFESAPVVSRGADQRARTDTAGLDDYQSGERFHLRPAYNPSEYRWGNRHASIIDFALDSRDALHVRHIDRTTAALEVRALVLFHRDVKRPIFGLIVKTKDGVTVSGVNTVGQAELSSPRSSGELVGVGFMLTPHLLPGDYFLSLGVAEGAECEPVPLDRRYDSIHLRITGQTNQTGIVDLAPRITISRHQVTRAPNTTENVPASP